MSTIKTNHDKKGKESGLIMAGKNKKGVVNKNGKSHSIPQFPSAQEIAKRSQPATSSSVPVENKTVTASSSKRRKARSKADRNGKRGNSSTVSNPAPVLSTPLLGDFKIPKKRKVGDGQSSSISTTVTSSSPVEKNSFKPQPSSLTSIKTDFNRINTDTLTSPAKEFQKLHRTKSIPNKNANDATVEVGELGEGKRKRQGSVTPAVKTDQTKHSFAETKTSSGTNPVPYLNKTHETVTRVTEERKFKKATRKLPSTETKQPQQFINLQQEQLKSRTEFFNANHSSAAYQSRAATATSVCLPQNTSVNEDDEKQDEIDSMEVDFEIQRVSPTFTLTQPSKQLVVIPDTNVWVDNKNLLDQILSSDFVNGSGNKVPVTVVIPWMVLQEIERVPNPKQNNGSRPGFRSAVKYINNLLSSKHPRVKGQKATEAMINGIEFKELMADDSILNCAIQHAKLPQTSTVFITNDINLLNKALVNDITSIKADSDLLSKLKEIIESDESKVDDRFISPPPPLATINDLSFRSSGSESFQENDIDDSMEVDDPMGYTLVRVVEAKANVSHNAAATITTDSEPVTFESVISAVRLALTSVIVLQMIEEYGEADWKEATKILPPYTLETALKCIEAHWIAVFSYIYSTRAKTVLDEMLRLFKNVPSGRTDAEMGIWRLEICQMTLVLFSMMDKEKAAARSHPRVVECPQLLQSYIQIEKTKV